MDIDVSALKSLEAEKDISMDLVIKAITIDDAAYHYYAAQAAATDDSCLCYPPGARRVGNPFPASGRLSHRATTGRPFSALQ